MNCDTKLLAAVRRSSPPAPDSTIIPLGEPPPWLLPAVKRAVEEAMAGRPAVAATPRFVELSDILRLVPVGERTFRELMRRGLVPYCRFPGARRILFDPAAVHAAVSRFSKGGLA
jgi:hypothetical protein